MLTKNCRIILDTILALGEEHHFECYRIADLSDRTGISFPQVLAACQELDRDGCANLHFVDLKNGRKIPESVSLTEFGVHYRDYQRAQRLRYIGDKWIDFLALVIASVSLIISIAAFLRPLPG